LDDLHAALARFWAGVDRTVAHPPDALWRARFATAVAEIGANIIRHGRPPTVRPQPMRLRLRAFRDRAEARFTDDGLPFNRQVPRPQSPTAGIDLNGVSTGAASAAGAIYDPGGPDDALDIAEDGYGLQLARAAVDELAYSRTATGQNRWRLVKRF
jgi:anti-sigma regulatory factor (Ser/Thr protein kinase)